MNNPTTLYENLNGFGPSTPLYIKVISATIDNATTIKRTDIILVKTLGYNVKVPDFVPT